MSYTHTNKTPVVLKNDPIDADSTDWVFFSYQDWLRDGETITDHSGMVENGDLETDSTYIGTLDDSEGTEFSEVYGIQVTPTAGAATITVTHRISTTVAGAVDYGRLNIDHSATLRVTEL